MKQQVLLGLLVLVAAPAAARAEINWSGSASVRHLIRNNDDGLSAGVGGQNSSDSTRKDFQFRADLNAAGRSESLDWGVGLRTNSGSANSEWVYLRNNTDLSLGLERAYLRPYGEVLGGVGAVTIGRAKTVLLYDSIGQGFFDNDTRWDGLGWSWQSGKLGLNLAQYALGARSQGVFGSTTYSASDATDSVATTTSGFGALYSFQPFTKFQLSDELEGLVAVGYHVWQGTTGAAFENAIHGGTAAPTATTNLTGDNRDPIIMDNARQWQILTDWSLPGSFRFVGEYVRNKKVVYGTRLAGGHTNRGADNDMLALSLAYGKVKRAKDWSIAYSFVDKGIASVVNSFSNGNQPADNTGHLLDAKYMLAAGLVIGAKVELYREKAKLDGAGAALMGAGQNRRQGQDRFEFVAAAVF